MVGLLLGQRVFLDALGEQHGVDTLLQGHELGPALMGVIEPSSVLSKSPKTPSTPNPAPQYTERGRYLNSTA